MTTASGLIATIAAFAVLHWYLRGDRNALTRIAWFRPADARIGRYRLWVTRAWLAFGAAPLLGLTLLGRGEALAAMPPEFDELATVIGSVGPVDWAYVLAGSAIGMALSIALLALLTWWRARRGRPPPGTIGDTSRVMPQRRAELPWGAAMAVTAGVSEEVMFRLLLPLALTLATGSAAAGFALATLSFGAMHRYQGWAGIAVTTLTGALFAALYLLSGQLWLAMAWHVAIDLVGLVVRPLLAGVWKIRP